MKLKTLSALVAAGGLVYAGAASALSYTVTPDIDLYVGGASAQDANLEETIASLCEPGTLDIYYDAAKSGGSQRAYYCQMTKTKVSGLTISPAKVLIHKRVSGGSAMGVYPLVGEVPINFMALNATCTASGTKTVLGTAYPLSKCNDANSADPTTFVKKVPDLGISDVNPGLFKGSNLDPINPDGGANFAPVNSISKLTILTGATLSFGAPVSLPLYRALQKAQVASGVLASGCEGSETEDCMPNLSREFVASLFTGRIKTWDKVQVVDATGAIIGKLTDFGDGTQDPQNLVRICRRVTGSGTQAVINAKFMNSPCALTANSPTALASSTGPVAILGSGTGDVRNCLNDYAAGTNAFGKNDAEDSIPGSVVGWAIGTLSTESGGCGSEGCTTYPEATKFRFVKIDGSSPKLENLYSGKYPIVGEVSYQYLKVAVKPANLPTANEKVLINTLSRNASDATRLGANNASFIFPWGRGGFIASPASGATVPSPYVFDKNKPVTVYTTGPKGQLVDNCRTPVVDDKLPRDVAM